MIIVSIFVTKFVSFVVMNNGLFMRFFRIWLGDGFGEGKWELGRWRDFIGDWLGEWDVWCIYLGSG